MINPKVNNQPQAKTVVGPEMFPGNVAVKRDSVTSQEIVCTRAYELYEQRGRAPGQDEQDWLRAEQEILDRER